MTINLKEGDDIMTILRHCMFVLLFAVCAFTVQAAPVNINLASADEISKSLTGIGTSKAEAIVSYRQQHGAFASADDLAQVKGIGLKTIEKNRKDILLSGQ
jgi:competence protein ComEA